MDQNEFMEKRLRYLIESEGSEEKALAKYNKEFSEKEEPLKAPKFDPKPRPKVKGPKGGKGG